MHVLPQVRKIEERFAREIVVIGVHAGKFLNERRTDGIRRAAERLGVHHPVVNDRQFRVWRAYAVHAWPTLTLVDPDGNLIAARAGEVAEGALEPVIGNVVREFEKRGRLNRNLLSRLGPQEPTAGDETLAYPGKVHAAGDRLFVSDTGHHRILVLRLRKDGPRATLEHVIGSVEPGFQDGPFASSRFREPQGLALVGEVLYVADRANHAVRAVALGRGEVRTVAGTGHLGRWVEPGPALSRDLRSPWDVCAVGETLFIAMAGSHQIWALDLTSGELRAHAGSGHEDIHDGPAELAALAQPSGLATDGRRLYFADAESSAVRWVDVEPGGSVGTLVGTGLFDFGDRDGVADEVRLQHPLAIALRDGVCIVADAYNHKLKRLGIATRTCTAWLGSGEPGFADGEAPAFDEPGGLSLWKETRLYVADTNNHRIRVVDLRRGAVETLRID